jgi:MoaA/NifB/PqqE/SkfB family radical SAM enzyme
MPIPLVVRNTLANAALSALGWRERTAYHPISTCFLLTYRCDLACSYCLENVRHRCPDGTPRELDTAGVVRTLRGIREVCDAIDLSGGEPALRPDLPQILAACRALGFYEIMLNTNALHLEGELGFLRDAHCVLVGVDSLREAGFRRITGGTAEQQARQLATLERLRRLRDELGFDLEICTVLLPGLLEEVEPILAWCFEHRVGLSLSPCIDRELRVAEGLRRDPAYFALCERLVEYRRQGLPLAGTVGYYEGLRDLGPFHCLPMSNLTVDPLGRIFWPCGELQHPGPSFLEGKPFRTMIDEARAAWGPLPECRDRCHFACRMLLSDVAARPWRMLAELRHLRSFRRT